MRFKWSAQILLILIILSVSGCSLLSQGGSESDSTYLPQDSPALSENFSFLDNQSWPDYIPDAIPELEGDISNIMVAPESHIRIFYENVSDRQIENYLSLLQEQGFELTYIVYQQEGFPDNSDERLAKGDYDAVDITKGEYHMNLSSGDGTAVYDVYTDGFEDLAAQATQAQWPDDLENVLPVPESCSLTSIQGNLESGYSIQCRCDSQDALQNYGDQLVAHGFSLMDETTTVEGDIINRKLKTETLAVTLFGDSNPNLTIEVETFEPLEWPAIFGNDVPQPANCTLLDHRTAGPNTVYVDCVPMSDDVLANYAAALNAIGFDEAMRLLDESENPYMILLTRDQDMVTLSIDSPNLVNISIFLVE